MRKGGIMKIKIILLFLLVYSTMFSQWEEQQSLKIQRQRTTLRNITSSDAYHIWAVGDTGVIIYSTDKGKTWTSQNSGVSDNLFVIQFIDSLQGWVGGVNSVLLTTSNSGKTWTRQEFITPRLRLRSLCFSDSTNGWIAATPVSGTQPLLYRTRNCGKTWQEVSLPSNVNTNLLKVQFVDTIHGWMNSARKIYYTTNGGNEWNVFDNNGDLYSFYRDFQFLDNNIGYCLIDLNFKIYIGHTTDGGVTWAIDSSIAKSVNGIDARLHFANTLFGCAIGYGFIAVTTDGGLNWNVTNRNYLPGLFSVRILDQQNIIAAGVNSSYTYSTDRGITWNNQVPLTPVTLRKVKYQTQTLLWAVGGTNTLLQSTDGGVNWRKIGIPTGMNINGMTFPDSVHSWVLDDSARIFRTIDRGNTWEMQSTGLNSGLENIFFTDSLFGCTVGLNGATLVTTNGGSDWNSVINAISKTFYDVIFVNRNAGWVVGESGTIARAYDSGKSWELQTSPTNTTLRSVSFSDTINGIVVGDSGVVLRTTNGGASWILQSLGSILLFRNVKMLGATGWMVGDSGNIRSSTDFGSSWTIQNSGTTTSLLGVDFITQRIGSIVGDGMTVLLTRNGGSTYVEDRRAILDIDSYQLYNNYPNPFNPSTNISYFLPHHGYVHLIIYNILGQRIKTIVNEEKNGGNYSLLWEPNNLPSGVYFYRLEINGISLARKMLYLK
jgi:photosystem II stability/assembly factor-like uncharacterized protein